MKSKQFVTAIKAGIASFKKSVASAKVANASDFLKKQGYKVSKKEDKD